MKLAEALMVRSDLQKALASLKQRIVANAVVQEGNAPHEDPRDLQAQAFRVMSELERMVLVINAANHDYFVADEMSLAAAIARRDTLTAQHALLQQAIAGSHKEPDRYSMSEIKWVATCDVAAMQRHADALAKNIRELNVSIQARNWDVEVSLDGSASG